jgi:hypothetical protein
MKTLILIGCGILLLCFAPWAIIFLPLFWGGNKVMTKVETKVDPKNDGSYSGCLFGLGSVIFLGIIFLIVVSTIMMAPDDCKTIAINIAMNRCP